MLKFFRGIRLKLIDNGNLKRYLVYAIGEILLVVIGILIALQINTWKEKTLDYKAESTALLDLKKEFIYNQNRLNVEIEKKKKAEIELKDNLLIIMDRNLQQSKKAVGRGLTAAGTTDISNSALNTILSTGKIDKIENDSLKYLLNNWKDVFNDYRKKEDLYSDFIQTQLQDYERKLFPTYNRGTNQAVKFYENFHSKQEIEEFQIKANSDMYYQNLLIESHFKLVLLLDSSKRVQDNLNHIINILNQEIRMRNIE